MNTSCPLDVQEAIERRCSAARTGDLQPYGALLRTNALTVVSSMFPRFAIRRGKRLLDEDIDEFIRRFSAINAQFIHLGSEFVRFSEGRFDDVISRALLEYEWTLFAVEIAEDRVAKPGDSESDNIISLEDVLLNPTTHLIAVPFDLNAESHEAEQMVRENRPPFVYAVYRAHDHRVLTQVLTALDIRMLRQLSGEPGQEDPEVRSTWIGNALQFELIVARHTQ